MSKNMLGVDIGNHELKLARRGNTDVTVYNCEIPANMVRDGLIQAPKSVPGFLRSARAKGHIAAAPCALVLPDSIAVCRRLTLPLMTQEQLALNLPYEFRDFVSNAADYHYDYAVLGYQYDENQQPTGMELMAAAAPKAQLDLYYHLFRRAGLHLKLVLPREMVYINLIRAYEKAAKITEPQEYCFVDLGYGSTRVHIFTGCRLQASRVIEIGGVAVNAALADFLHIDEYMADVYKRTNTQKSQYAECSQDVYNRIAIEIMKSINFYRFNNQDSNLNDLFFCGGESANATLINMITEVVQLRPHYLTELMPLRFQTKADPASQNMPACILAAAITQQESTAKRR